VKTNYIAWLNGQSVAMGALEDAERKARAIAATPLWRQWNAKTTLRITRGTRQTLVKSIVLEETETE